MPGSTGDLVRFTSTWAHWMSFPVSLCFSPFFCVCSSPLGPVFAPVFSSTRSACYYFLLCFADNVHKEQRLVIMEDGPMADHAANQTHRLGALPGLCCSCTRTSLSTIIGTKAWCKEDKMWALTIMLLCVGKFLQFSLSCVCVWDKDKGHVMI